MRRYLLCFLLLLTAVPVFSQKGEIVVKSGVNFSLDLADSLLYVLPEFRVGVVALKDGTRSQALLNINTISQNVCFINDSGDTLSVTNKNDIVAVYVSNRSFRRYGAMILEILNPKADVSVALGRSLSLLEPTLEGAYGSKSNVSSASTVNQFTDDTGTIKVLGDDLNVPWKYSLSVYLFKGDKGYLSSKKSFIKLFPSLSSFISIYLKENKVDFRKQEDTQSFLNLCLEQL